MNLQTFYARTAAVVAALAFAPMSQAALVSINANTTVQGSPYAPIATPSSGISTVDLSGKVGSTNFTLNAGSNAVTVATASNGAIVQGSSNGAYAAPVVNSSGAVVTAPYFSTGGTPGLITLSFASAQAYLGLLWGSIDLGNTLTFKSGASTVATVSGQDAINASIAFNGLGSQTFGGSQYILVNFLNGITFNSVVLSQSGLPSFEAATLQYAARNVSAVPEPGSVALLGLGLAGLIASRRRKTARI